MYDALTVLWNTKIDVSIRCVAFVLQKEQANFLLKMGALKGALDVFLRLHMWEDVIKCYKNLGQTEKVKYSISCKCRWLEFCVVAKKSHKSE